MDALSSGLGAYQTLFAAQANNIANANTDDYIPMRANLATTALGGVDVASITQQDGTQVDLTNEMPGTGADRDRLHGAGAGDDGAGRRARHADRRARLAQQKGSDPFCCTSAGPPARLLRPLRLDGRTADRGDSRSCRCATGQRDALADRQPGRDPSRFRARRPRASTSSPDRRPARRPESLGQRLQPRVDHYAIVRRPADHGRDDLEGARVGNAVDRAVRRHP